LKTIRKTSPAFSSSAAPGTAPIPPPTRSASPFPSKIAPAPWSPRSSELSKLGTNLTKIESRPVHGKPWEYIFYVDCQIHSSEEGSRALEALPPLRHGQGTGPLQGSKPAVFRANIEAGADLVGDTGAIHPANARLPASRPEVAGVADGQKNHSSRARFEKRIEFAVIERSAHKRGNLLVRVNQNIVVIGIGVRNESGSGR
jgi:hypothetical protein